MYSSGARLQAAAELLLRQRRREQQAQPQAPLPDFSDPVVWISQNFYIPETNQPIGLYPSQVIPLREALSTDDSGSFRYSTVVWSAIKKSAKSSLAAAVGLWFAWSRPWASIKVIANDLKQADSRVAYYMRRAIELRPDWRAACRIANYRIILPNHSIIEAVPIDPKGEAGGNDDLVIYSELWGWKQDSARRMWTETTLSPMKFGHSLRWCETYAGFSGESPILEDLYDLGVKNGQAINPDYEMYRNGRLFVLWNTRPSLPWQTDEYYAQEASTLLPNEFARIHRNAWASSTSQFVPAEWWAACQQKALPPIEHLEPWVIALDAGVDNDLFAMIGVTRRNDRIIVRYARTWKAPEGGQILYFAPEGTPPALDESPAGELTRLSLRHSVVKVVYDPYQLHSFAQVMGDKLIVWFEEFSQQSKRLLADKALRDDIRDGRIVYGQEPALTEHILNANAQVEGDEHLRLVKRQQSAKIDLAVCLSMAGYEAAQMGLG